jgi:glutamine amidotransferase
MIGIINYGMGNLASVKNSLDYLNISSKIISNPLDLYKIDKIILPGVGAFGAAIENLNSSGFSNTLKELVLVKNIPILGICLGMQLLLESSNEHGYHNGLGIIKGNVLFFGDCVKDLPVPHVGWNDVDNFNRGFLFKDISVSSNFYFVHSYFCKLQNSLDVSGTSMYGIEFHSALERENVFGCQFHPEKSQKVGLSIFRNFNTF